MATLASLVCTNTDAAIMPIGNTSQRPTPTAGMIRHNNQLGYMEFYNGSAWVILVI
jgi:hypothetical protein